MYLTLVFFKYIFNPKIISMFKIVLQIISRFVLAITFPLTYLYYLDF
jgi:hypothetical protein